MAYPETIKGDGPILETLEKIAENLELVDTDIVSQNWDPDSDWSCLTFGGAKG